MSTAYEYPEAVTMTDAQVGTSASQVAAGGAGQVQVTVVNDDATDTLYVGWDSTVSSSPATHFVGGSLAGGGSNSITLFPWRGPVYIEGSAAGVDYRVEVRYVKRSV